MGAPISIPPGFYQGTVLDANIATYTLKVTLAGTGQAVQGINAAGILSANLGVQSTFLPARGTQVIGWWTGTQPFLVTGFPPTERVLDPADNRQAADGPDMADVTGTVPQNGPNYRSHRQPRDLLPGELDMTNLLSVGVTLLTHLAQLKAGDAAQVEVSLLDEMVRIVSQNFQHVSSFGKFKILSDGGRVTCRWEGSGKEYETLNLLQPSDPRAGEAQQNIPDMPDESTLQNETGRYRFGQYIGWLGDFVHMWVTEPVTQLAKIGTVQYQSGRFKAHVNTDGSLLVQSVADIIFERVVRIPVPVEMFREEDPEGDLSSATFTSEFLQQWTPASESTLFHAAFQLREYARWMSNQYTLARFRQMTKDWQVPTEAQTPEPTPNAGDPDRTNNAAVNYLDRYACFRIFRDGTIVVYSGDGSSIVMGGNNVWVSAPADINLVAGGNINMLGKNVQIRAQDNVEITADTKGVIISAAQWLKGFCTQGGILLKTSLQSNNASPLPEHGAANSGNTNPNSVPAQHFIDGICLSSPNSFTQVAGRSFSTLISGNIIVGCIRKILKTTAGIFLYDNADVLQTTLNNQGLVTNGQVLASTRVAANVLQQQIQTPGPSPSPQGVHYNHVSTISNLNTQLAQALTDSISAAAATAAATAAKANMVYRAETDYGDAPLMETLTQQHLRIDSVAGFSSWNLSTGLRGDDASQPWPGPLPQQLQLNLGPESALDVPSAAVTFNPVGTPLTAVPAVIQTLT